MSDEKEKEDPVGESIQGSPKPAPGADEYKGSDTLQLPPKEEKEEKK